MLKQNLLDQVSWLMMVTQQWLVWKFIIAGDQYWKWSFSNATFDYSIREQNMLFTNHVDEPFKLPKVSADMANHHPGVILYAKAAGHTFGILKTRTLIFFEGLWVLAKLSVWTQPTAELEMWTLPFKSAARVCSVSISWCHISPGTGKNEAICKSLWKAVKHSQALLRTECFIPLGNRKGGFCRPMATPVDPTWSNRSHRSNGRGVFFLEPCWLRECSPCWNREVIARWCLMVTIMVMRFIGSWSSTWGYTPDPHWTC